MAHCPQKSTPVIDGTLLVMGAIGMAVLVSLAGTSNVFGDVAVPLQVEASTTLPTQD